MAFEVTFDAAKAVNTALRKSVPEWTSHKLFQKHPDVLGDFATKVTAALNGAPIEYVTGALSESSFEVTILTDLVLIFGTFDAVEGSSVSVQSLTGLEAVIIHSLSNVLSNKMDDVNQPLRVTLTVGGVDYTLPEGRSVNDEHENQLGIVLTKMLTRLAVA